jgi:predicted glycoside hydrolase/deacetylase ChbG (UPF0249 family)
VTQTFSCVAENAETDLLRQSRPSRGLRVASASKDAETTLAMTALTARRQVIFNADDFGLTEGVCRGIRQTVEAGVVTATSAMVCSEGAETRVAEWGKPLAGRIGVHLQLTQGRPCLETSAVPSIVDSEGAFPNATAGVVGVDLGQVRAEWGAQIGLKPHIVSAYVAVAVAAGLPARTNSPELSATLRARGARCVDLSTTAWYDGTLTEKRLLRVIEEAFDRLRGVGTIEVMCHPGYADADLAAKSNYVRQREAELGVLTSDKLKNGLSKLDVEVGSMDRVAA